VRKKESIEWILYSQIGWLLQVQYRHFTKTYLYEKEKIGTKKGQMRGLSAPTVDFKSFMINI
jgi:hypothetical protein